MTMHSDLSKTLGVRRFSLTAAMVALFAGAPVGMAQSSTEEAPDSFSGLMQFLSSAGGQQGQGGEAQELNEDEFRTDGLYYDQNMTVELHVQDEELTNVLQMLSLHSERNIVASNDVSATVTANLYGVTFHEALDAILHINGYGYIEKGNFIYVYPAELLDEIEQAARQREGRVFTLDFINAVDAADQVASLLSETGEIKTNGKAESWTDPSGPTGAEDFANLSTLIVYDFPENIEAIEDMLDLIDVRPSQILVEATIVQTTLNEANAFGVDFSIIADFDYADFASPLGAVDSLVRGTDGSDRVPADGGASALVGTAGDIGGPGTLKAGVVSNDVSVFLRMLNEVTSTTIISNPKVVTLNRQPGRVLVGRKVGYLQTTSTDTSTTQSVEFLDTGTQLNFRPFVMGDEGVIRMELKPQVSEASLRSATDAVGAAVTIPDEITNELVSNVMVPDGHTIVLGGLFRESTTTTRRQVPVLGDIPILGTAFRGHDDDIQRQEIIFMIKPSIVDDQVLVQQGIRGEEAVERARAGAREQTLAFSKQRQAAQLLVEAEHLARDGEAKQALHRVRRALQLVPGYDDAIELRERLVNAKDIWPSESVLDEIIHGNAEETRNNILQHGWWGAQGELPKPQQSSRRQAEPTERVTRTREALADAFDDSVAYPAAPNTGAWWTSPEFDVFMTYWSVINAVEEGREFEPEDRWWVSPQFIALAGAADGSATSQAQPGWITSPEFDTYMTTWASGIAFENGEMFDPTRAWWRTEQFHGVASALGATEQIVGTSYARGTTGNNDSSPRAQESFSRGEWWTSPEFRLFLETWVTESAHEDGRPTPDVDAWFDSREFRVFMQAFDSAVTEARDDGYLPATTFTNVPTDSQD